MRGVLVALPLLAAAVVFLLPPAGAAGEFCAVSVSGTAGASPWYRSAVTASISGHGSLTYRIDNGAETVYTSPVTVTGEGAHTVVCYASDGSGNKVSASATFSIDLTLPACYGSFQTSGAPTNGWYRTAVGWSQGGSDALSGLDRTEYSVNGSVFATYTGAFTLPEGQDTVVCRAVDLAGNVYTSAPHQVAVDTQPPTGCGTVLVFDASRGATLAPSNGWYSPANPASTGVQHYVAGDDATSGAYTLLLQSEARVDTISSGWYHTVFGEGVKQITCTVTDAAGNSAVFPITLRLDGTPPTCSGAYTGAPGREAWYTSGAFVIAARDDGSGLAHLNYTIAGSFVSRPQTIAGGVGPSSATETISREGDTTIQCVATDAAGHSSASATFRVRLDTTPPSCGGVLSGKEGADGWRLEAAEYALDAT
ncbi:MAG TPA: hypothetical protein VHH36_09670, partial [Candidatus Thermoplasmatota archaeon]|nr:hypothetical protein [Candidatus Thermoplasmatota archaeon]